MEKTASTEYKIRRAEEIYNNRRENQYRPRTAKVNINVKKDFKLFKKLCIQIILCLAIYSVFYLVKNNNYIFTEDFINKSNEILAYDMDFKGIFSKCYELIKNKAEGQNKETENQENAEETNTTEESKENETIENTKENNDELVQENGIGGAEEEKEEKSELSQMEQDALDIKKSISFIKPLEGTITSRFGMREPTTSTVPKNHTGLDIANKLGTPICSSTDGEVVLASSQGDYR